MQLTFETVGGVSENAVETSVVLRSSPRLGVRPMRPGPLTTDPGDPTDPGAMALSALLVGMEEVGIPMPRELVPDELPVPVSVDSRLKVLWL